MTRRITTSRFNWFARRYEAMLKTAVRGVLDKGENRRPTSVSFEELLSEAYKNLLYAMIHFENNGTASFSTYMFARVNGTLRNMKRQYARQVRDMNTVDNDCLAEDHEARTTDAELQAHVNEVLRCLNDIERQVVTETFMWNKPSRKVAEELGISKTQVARILTRSLDRLRSRFPGLVVCPDPEPDPEAVAA